MDTDYRFEFIKAINKGSAYDFIANNYYKMDKDTLKDICLECIYELMNTDSDISVVAECLDDLWGEF